MTIQNNNYIEHGYELSVSNSSRSLPFPLGVASVDENMLEGRAAEGEGALGEDAEPGLLEPFELASCQAGIDGRPTIVEGEGALGMVGPLLSSNAFRDLSSCCSSVRDCVCISLFFSIIYQMLAGELDRHNLFVPWEAYPEWC